MKKSIIKIKRKLPSKFYLKLKRLRKNLQYLLYLGNKYYCPFCGRSYRKFLTFSKQRRPNMACPKDYSVDRHRLLLLFLKNRTPLFKENLKVLHFSPQKCFLEKFKTLSNLEYISSHLKSPKVSVNMDITNIIYGDNIFDAIICIHVLEHVIEDQKAMKELFRVLKPGGWAILQCPIDPSLEKTYENVSVTSMKERKRIFGHFQHVRIYGRDFKDRLENSGFIVKVDDYAKSLNPDIIKKYRLNTNDEIYYCTKIKSSPLNENKKYTFHD